MLLDFSQVQASRSGLVAASQALEDTLDDLTFEELLRLRWGLQWKSMARSKQLPPAKFLLQPDDFSVWGIRSGRGFGKTLSAAQWIAQEGWDDPGSINFVVAPTYDDARYTCFEGPTGLYSVIPPALIDENRCNRALPSITLKNGSYFRGFAADTPNRLRGPQCHRAWCEEIATWKYPEEAWSNLEFGLRLGDYPQIAWTSTPRPTAFMKERSNDPRAIVVLGSTYENRENLTKTFYANVAKYEGTKIGRQELLGELIDPEEAGFVKRSQWRLWPANRPLPKFAFILISLDTAFTDKTFDKKKQRNDPTACSVWGVFEQEKLPQVMLIDAWEDYLGFPQLVMVAKQLKDRTFGDADEPIIKPLIRGRDRAGHQGRKADLILIEEKGSGISLRQQLALENIFTRDYNPGKLDKLSRLHIVTPLFAHRRVWTVESSKKPGMARPWAEPLISQVCTFVGEGSIEHDDLLDTATQGLRYLMDRYFPAFTVKVDKDDAARKRALRKLKSQKGNPYSS